MVSKITARKKTIAAGLAALALGTGTAIAATVENVSGVVYEGGVAPASGAPPADITLGDFNSDIGDPTLIIVGDTAIYGGVAHRTRTRYFDSWSMDFGTRSYAAEFSWQKTSANFDGRLVVNGLQYDLGGAGAISLGNLNGLVTFNLDPLFGRFGPNPDEVATWDLQVSEVPLPAGMVLMLTGIAGFAGVRWMKKA